MTPEQIQAWIQLAQLATGVIGASLVDVKKWIADVHGTVDEAGIDKVYAALDADALVRENIARQLASG